MKLKNTLMPTEKIYRAILSIRGVMVKFITDFNF